jgi:hypothetical protein
MPDPILDELWRVRDELVKKHGGFEAYFKHLQKLDRARRRQVKHPGGKEAARQRLKKS